MIKLIATGYSKENSCEEIFLDNSFNVVKRRGIEGIQDASFIAVKDSNTYFVSEESQKYAKIHEIAGAKIINTINLDTDGIVYLSFLDKCGIIVSGSYTSGVVIAGNEKKLKVGKVHCIVPDSLEHYIYITDIANDKILVYDLFRDCLAEEIELPKGCGPRHLKFYKEFLYLATEYSNEIFVFLHNSSNGSLQLLDKYSTYDKSLDIENYAAAIDILDDVLAVSNRGKNTISFFKVLQDGKLEFLYEISCFGDWPRDIKFFKNYLFVANERSNTICVFDTNDKSGKLLSCINKIGANYMHIMEEEF